MLYQLSYFRKLKFVIQNSERWVPRTGLEPACLSTHAPETCASTNSATWAEKSEKAAAAINARILEQRKVIDRVNSDLHRMETQLQNMTRTCMPLYTRT